MAGNATAITYELGKLNRLRPSHLHLPGRQRLDQRLTQLQDVAGRAVPIQRDAELK